MAEKRRYEELEQRVRELEAELEQRKAVEQQLLLAQEEEAKLLEMTRALSQELNLDRLLLKIMQTTQSLLSAERCTLFVYDKETDELWARATEGSETTHLRFSSHHSVAGAAFHTGEIINVPDAYSDPRFNPELDQKTGFLTKTILCMPVKNKLERTLGIIQVLNKQGGAAFTVRDEGRLAACSAYACIALENAKLFEELIKKIRALQKEVNEHKTAQAQLKKAKDEQAQFLEMACALSQELNLNRLLLKIMHTTKLLLSAERCTLFLYDERHRELWARATDGAETRDIRFPCHLGIAGTVFTTGQIINIPDAYSDPRFNQEVDKQTGFHTRSILCMPVKNKDGEIFGVFQVLNKVDGVFTEHDATRLNAFSAQVCVALENAKLFEDVLNMKNYNESMLESMSNGVLSLNAEKRIVTGNAAALRILQQDNLDALVDVPVADVFDQHNPWLLKSIDKVMTSMKADLTMDTDLVLRNGHALSVNLTIVPLINIRDELIGSLLIFEDITREKRLKGTMTRYMAKQVVDKLLERGEAMLGGIIQEATIMFADIRNFTTISERNSPQETVSMLNEYFSLMVDIIHSYEGILDKYIGDALLAVFGAPFPSGNDPDQAVKTAIDMLDVLEEFNRKRRAEGKGPINIGIGISTNNVLSGNIGSLKRMDYTVIGDGVNIASRLEGVNKIYGTRILISEFTYHKLTEYYVCREIDLIRVKGKFNPVGIYQIFGREECAAFPHLDEVLELFQEGLTQYRKRDWHKGIEYFQRILSLNEHDSVSQVYLDRCRHFSQNPPPDEWDHVWTLTSK